MATRSEAPDLAVDDLRRKARRRLVGAIVLALAAAVALPLLLENEPKPLGDDVSIQIPPIDSGKFVTPLSPAAPPDAKTKSDKPAPKSDKPAPETAPPPVQAPATSEPAKTDSAKTDSAKADAGAMKADSGSGKADSGSPSAALPGVPAAAGEAPAAKSAVPAPSAPSIDAKSMPSAETKADSQRTGGFVVQVAAFSDRYGARSLVAKLKKSGFPGYIETVASDKGTLHRVRVGPYASRESADAARAKLKAAGFSGVVSRSG